MMVVAGLVVVAGVVASVVTLAAAWRDHQTRLEWWDLVDDDNERTKP